MEIREVNFSELDQVLSLYDDMKEKNLHGRRSKNRKIFLSSFVIAAVVY